MDITVTIPDANVDRVAAAIGNGPGALGQEVTADNLAEVLTERFEEQIRQAVQSHEAGVAATAAARAIADAPDPLSTKKGDTFATVQEAVAEARSVRLAAAANAEAVEAVLSHPAVEVKG